MDSKWFVLHPKIKKFALAVVTLLVGSALAVLNNTVSLNDAGISDVTAILGLALVYLSPAE